MTIVKTDSEYRVRLGDEDCARFSPPMLSECGLPRIEIDPAGDGWQRIRMQWDVPREVAQDELSVQFDLAFDPDFWWSPHLAPSDGYVAGQHVFRSPAMIVQRGSLTLAVVPDLEAVGRRPENPWFMDHDALQGKLWLGMVKTDIPYHVLFRKTPGMKFAPGAVELSFFLTAYHDRGEVRNPWARTARFLWERWGRPRYAKGEPVRAPIDRYVDHTYDWALEGWGDFVWQEFDLEGKRVGAPQFIVNISQSPNYPGEWYQREFLSIWNQAWFSSLRSASGLFRYARSAGDAELLRKARMTKELALTAPMKDGIFPSVIATRNREVEIDGKKYRRPEGWEHAFWINSNRSPRDHGITWEWYHVLDASFTALLMLRWYDELEPDDRLLRFARTYAERLLALQNPDGFFPGWLHPEKLEPGPVMNRTPESSMSATFLLKLAEVTGERKYHDAAMRAMDALLAEIVPEGRWEDFETYWSCCRWGRDEYLGRKIERSAMHKQNSFSMFWTAEALLKAYQASGNPRYLLWGRRTLDELSMCQQVWQPPFIHVPALGGFGVMNADGEWNDSRETLFAELFLDYYRETGEVPYFERGICALKSGFIMMYCPENPEVMKMWEKVYPWFGPEDYGFTMENYAHGGRTSPEGEGMGVFTIYDWGNGAASEAAMRILDHYGHVYIDRGRGRAFGIDRIRVRSVGQEWELIDETGGPRDLRIVFDDGSVQTVKIGTKAVTVAAPAGGVDLGPVFEKWKLEPRVQGNRNTCSVFTVAGAMEYALANYKGRGERLSVEFLNWASNQVLGETEDGSFFSDLWNGFAKYGVCPEQDMPYRAAFDPHLRPDEEAMNKALKLHEIGLRLHWIKPWDVNTGLTERQFLETKRVLDRKWPVCGGFRWPRKPVKWTDDLLETPPPEGVVDGHSVLITGYRDDPDHPGGGVFLFHNSNNDGRDGMMTYAYARAYMNDAVWIDY